MRKNNARRDPVPNQFEGIEKAAEFWETHDLTDYEDIWQEVDFHVNFKRSSHPSIELEPEIADEFAKRARANKTSLDSYVNDALREYLKKRTAR